MSLSEPHWGLLAEAERCAVAFAALTPPKFVEAVQLDRPRGSVTE